MFGGGGGRGGGGRGGGSDLISFKSDTERSGVRGVLKGK